MEENNNLSSQLDLSNLSEENRAKILTKTGELLKKRILLRIEEEMNEKQMNEFQKLLEERGDDPNKIEEYLRENIPNIDEITKEEVEKTREAIFDQVKELKL